VSRLFEYLLYVLPTFQPCFPDHKKTLVFGNSDIHRAPRTHLPAILSYLGQNITLISQTGSYTQYPFVFKLRGVKVSISSTFYVQIFHMNVVSAACTLRVRRSYEKRVRIKLMKLTADIF